mmetsp:Transcript_1467/g.3256  ORF Transcript_1467/g.3256 Transcript_1467/m.3256 type:complete len:102 (-) Transcript_1467:3101-3406(-)
MEFTTKFELQSQATRLVESICQGTIFPGKNGSFTLSAALFQGTWPGNTADNTSPDHNSVHHCFHIGYTDSHGELFPLHSPLLRESLLVSFPPLNYMLKFGG